MQGMSVRTRVFLFRCVLAAFTGVILLVTLPACNSKKTVAVGLSSPDLEVNDAVTGQPVSAADLAGKVLFVNFWASWCPPCKEEMPSIESVYREFGGRNDFRMITILYNDEPDEGIGYLKANGYTFPVYKDNDSRTARNFGVTGVPETYLISKKGLLKRKVIGALDWSGPEERQSILSLLSE